jgi:hypothetical protein
MSYKILHINDQNSPEHTRGYYYRIKANLTGPFKTEEEAKQKGEEATKLDDKLKEYTPGVHDLKDAPKEPELKTPAKPK